MFKKITTASALMVFSISTTQAIYFTDADQFPTWAKESIENVAEEDIMTGFGDGTFQPWKEINRAEAVTMLLRIKNISTQDVTPHDFFDDVESNDWFAKAVTVASEKGWVVGKSKSLFYPADRINRAEFATILTRSFELDTENLETTSKCRDLPTKAWYTSSINALHDNSLVRSPNSLFCYPEKNVTRAEAAWIFSKILNMPRLNGTSQENDFSENLKNDARRTAIRPRDFNKYKQGYDVEKKEVRISAQPNGETIEMSKTSDWTDLGTLTMENALDTKLELDSILFKLRFKTTGVGPAGNFFVRISNPDGTITKELKAARTGEFAFTGLDLNIETGQSEIFTLAIKPDEEESFYSRSGYATFSAIDAKGFSYGESAKESSNTNYLAKFAIMRYNSREFSNVKFTP